METAFNQAIEEFGNALDLSTDAVKRKIEADAAFKQAIQERAKELVEEKKLAEGAKNSFFGPLRRIGANILGAGRPQKAQKIQELLQKQIKIALERQLDKEDELIGKIDDSLTEEEEQTRILRDIAKGGAKF